jgi:cytochrome c-type biogenesis protein CcmH/NrfG
MGWLIVLVLALAAFAAIWRYASLDRAGVQFLAAALLLALAGYAWLGSPGLAGSPRRAAERPAPPQTVFSATRRDIFGGFDRVDNWLTLSEALARGGDTAGAAGIVRSALRKYPDNAVLWTGYGDALTSHGGGLLSPAADLAFRRGISLAPRHPGPRIFYGLALAQNGRLEEAGVAWRQALALSPADSKWREGLEQQLRMLEEARAAGR